MANDVTKDPTPKSGKKKQFKKHDAKKYKILYRLIKEIIKSDFILNLI